MTSIYENKHKHKHMPTRHWVGKDKVVKLWEAKAGAGFRYMMLFDNNPVNGAERLSDALRKLAQL